MTNGSARPRTLPHIVEGRIVYTYQPSGWPEGVLTGFFNTEGGCVLEYVIAWRGGALMPMMHAGIAEAWDRGARYILFQIPPDHPQARGLQALAKRMRFEEYSPGWYVRYPDLTPETWEGGR